MIANIVKIINHLILKEIHTIANILKIFLKKKRLTSKVIEP